MSQEKIEKLTPEQEAMIPVYREKWRKIAFSTEPIDKEKAAEAVRMAYGLIGKQEPKILFWSSPKNLLDRTVVLRELNLNDSLTKSRAFAQNISFVKNIIIWVLSTIIVIFTLNKQLGKWQILTIAFISYMLLLLQEILNKVRKDKQTAFLEKDIGKGIISEISIKRDDQIEQLCIKPIEVNIFNSIYDSLSQEEQIFLNNQNYYFIWHYHELDKLLDESGIDINSSDKRNEPPMIAPELWACSNSLVDFCISVLQCPYDQQIWEVSQALAKHCGWIFPYEKIAIICDRPRILSFDNQQRLHAEGAPAIQFADGYSLYAYHGVTLPEEYGKIHPNQWQASWLLEEENAELRRVLIQGIGYERIASELGAIELDSFQEYRLLKINNDVDVEPIYLLKMTCPSTGYIHVLRVPPDVESAREAIRWINWGVDPEEFAVQT